MKISKLSVIIAAVAPLILIPYSDYFYFPKIYFIYLVSAFGGIIWILNRKTKTARLGFEEKLIGIYGYLILFSTFFSYSIAFSFFGRPMREEGLIALLTYIFLFFLTSRRYEFGKNDVIAVLLSASVVSIYGIIQYFGFDPIPRDPWRIDWAGRAFATMGNPNFLGSYLTLMLPIGVFAYIKKGNVLFLVAACILYTCLLVTFTRSAMIGSFAGFLIIVWYVARSKRNIKKMIVLMLCFLLITVAIEIQSEGQIISRTLSIGKDFSKFLNQDDGYETGGSNRVYIWGKTLILIKDRPLLGYGIETLGLVFTEKFGEEANTVFNTPVVVDKAHNEYLHIAYSTGIPSLIIYLIFLGVVIRNGFKRAVDCDIMIPALAAIIGYAVQAFFNISVVAVAPIFWILLGFIENKNIQHQNSSFT